VWEALFKAQLIWHLSN